MQLLILLLSIAISNAQLCSFPLTFFKYAKRELSQDSRDFIVCANNDGKFFKCFIGENRALKIAICSSIY